MIGVAMIPNMDGILSVKFSGIPEGNWEVEERITSILPLISYYTLSFGLLYHRVLRLNLRINIHITIRS
jgi:hypothetical protein